MTEFFAVLFAILCVDVAYRICAASARDWKHSKAIAASAAQRRRAGGECWGFTTMGTVRPRTICENTSVCGC